MLSVATCLVELTLVLQSSLLLCSALWMTFGDFWIRRNCVANLWIRLKFRLRLRIRLSLKFRSAEQKNGSKTKPKMVKLHILD